MSRRREANTGDGAGDDLFREDESEEGQQGLSEESSRRKVSNQVFAEGSTSSW